MSGAGAEPYLRVCGSNCAHTYRTKEAHLQKPIWQLGSSRVRDEAISFLMGFGTQNHMPTSINLVSPSCSCFMSSIFIVGFEFGRIKPKTFVFTRQEVRLGRGG